MILHLYADLENKFDDDDYHLEKATFDVFPSVVLVYTNYRVMILLYFSRIACAPVLSSYPHKEMLI